MSAAPSSRPTGRPEAAAFATVYDNHVSDVYAFFAYRIPSRSAAEDLTQSTFERALRAWGRFDPSRAEPRTWLLAIARNLLIDHYRRAAKRPESLAGDAADIDVLVRPPTEADEHDLGPDVAAALTALSDREREVIALRFGADLATSDIGDLLGLTAGNVQQILSRATRTLRRRLDTRNGH